MNQPPKKRRKFSFSLRTLMVFMLALCLLFGFIGIRLQRAKEQQAFLRELRESGWSIITADGFHVNETPNFWELVIDSNYLHSIEIVSYKGDVGGEFFSYKGDVGGEDGIDLAPLLEIKNLQELYISNTQVSDLLPLVELMNLQRLYAMNTQVSILTPLAKLENLSKVVVSNTQVSDQQIQQLKDVLPKCEIYGP